MNILLDSSDLNEAVADYIAKQYNMSTSTHTFQTAFTMGRNGNGLRAEVKVMKAISTCVEHTLSEPALSEDEILMRLQEADLLPDPLEIPERDGTTKPLFTMP